MKIFGWILLLMVALTGLKLAGSALGWFSEAAQVAKEEFGPKAALKKYEWFKDASEQIRKLDSDIRIYEEKQALICIPGMDRISREQCMLWSQEVAGIKSAYNDTVAEYNAQSQKFNWEMFDTTQIPTSYKER